MLNIPVLFLIFNRPQQTQLVFNKIREIKPKVLYVAADGPRGSVEGEKALCILAREIATSVDWGCKLITLFRDKNLGCGRAVSEAISWFFDNEEQGIILEDDCLPDSSFFPFCEELLEKYKDNQQIFLISGFNRLGRWGDESNDYFFSKSAGIWGWASWRRAWGIYKFEVPEWHDENCRITVLNSLPNDSSRRDMIHHLDLIDSGSPQISWDFQWWFYRQLYNGIGIIPNRNLISNIGFGKDATHTTDINNEFSKVKASTLKFPLRHPSEIIENLLYESIKDINYGLSSFDKEKSLFQRLKLKLWACLRRKIKL